MEIERHSVRVLRVDKSMKYILDGLANVQLGSVVRNTAQTKLSSGVASLRVIRDLVGYRSSNKQPRVDPNSFPAVRNRVVVGGKLLAVVSELREASFHLCGVANDNEIEVGDKGERI